MDREIEAQFQRQAEIDRAIEEKITIRYRRRRRTICIVVIFSFCLLGYGLWFAYEWASVSGPSVEDHYQDALQQQEKGNLQASANALKQVLQLEPEHADARWMLGLLYVSLGDGEAAEKKSSKTKRA